MLAQTLVIRPDRRSAGPTPARSSGFAAVAYARAVPLVFVLLSACNGAPGPTSKIRHLFDVASRPVLSRQLMAERTTESLAEAFPPGTAVESLVQFMHGIGGRCEEGNANSDETGEGLTECFYSNVSYGTGASFLYARLYYEQRVHWRLVITRTEHLIGEVRVAVEKEELLLTKEAYTTLRSTQIEAERASSTQEVTRGEN